MKVYIIGLGHIGLPLAVWIAGKGHTVVGIDSNKELIDQIENGTILLYEYHNGRYISEMITDLILCGQLKVLHEFHRDEEQPAVFIITIGIRPEENIEKAFEPVQKVISGISSWFVPQDLLLLRTTMIPGMCEMYVIPQIPSYIRFAYWPETLSEGNAFSELEHHPNILAPLDEESFRFAEEFIMSLSNAPVVRASNMTTAEIAKIMQNIIRDVNIALANEVNDVAKALAIDMKELHALCNLHPRVDLLSPGPGVGGFCLPHALPYLLMSCFNTDCNIDLMKKARAKNEERPQYVVDAVIKALKSVGKDVRKAKIAVSGIAMKDFCSDCRYSPALEIIHILLLKGAQVQAYDPLIPSGKYWFQVASLEECVAGADCLLITALQPGVEYCVEFLIKLMAPSPVIADTRWVISWAPASLLLIRP